MRRFAPHEELVGIQLCDGKGSNATMNYNMCDGTHHTILKLLDDEDKVFPFGKDYFSVSAADDDEFLYHNHEEL